MVTMSQKSSVLQPAKSVSQVLTPDTPGTGLRAAIQLGGSPPPWQRSIESISLENWINDLSYRIALCGTLFFSRPAASATCDEDSLETVSSVGDIGQIGKCDYDGTIRLHQGVMPSGIQ
jgi:hypothetical protein